MKFSILIKHRYKMSMSFNVDVFVKKFKMIVENYIVYYNHNN